MRESVVIESLLRETAPYAAEAYRRRGVLTVSSKSEVNDVLTEVDLEVQRRVVERIRAEFPADRIVAEEAGLTDPPEDPDARCWVIDPIDGTQNFVRGLFPIFGISIGFVQNGVGVAAGVALPALNDFYLAERGKGATRNGARIYVSQVGTVGESRVEIDFGQRAIRQATLNRFSTVVVQAGQMRCQCAAVVSLAAVAAGEADAFLHIGLSPWDYAAAALLVEEAGGMTSHLDGAPVHLFRGNGSVLATNGRIHAEALWMIKSGV